MKYTDLWFNNENGTNEIGFSGLPGGGRLSQGSFETIGFTGSWWSSTPMSESHVVFHALSFSDHSLLKGGDSKGLGVAVRGLKD